jgi:hypothetical protein
MECVSMKWLMWNAKGPIRSSVGSHVIAVIWTTETVTMSCFILKHGHLSWR